jgi:hypothetical protein
MFIDKTNRTYNAIYDDTGNKNLSIKNDLLVKILLRGILEPIKNLMVLNQMLPEVTTWDDAQRAALRCETTLYETQTSNGVLELPTFTSSNIDTLAATALQQQQKQIEELQTKLSKINFIGESPETKEDTIFYFGTQSTRKTTTTLPAQHCRSLVRQHQQLPKLRATIPLLKQRPTIPKLFQQRILPTTATGATTTIQSTPQKPCQ